MTKKELLALLKHVPDHAEIIRPEPSTIATAFNPISSITKVKIMDNKLWSMKGKYKLTQEGTNEAYLLY